MFPSAKEDEWWAGGARRKTQTRWRTSGGTAQSCCLSCGMRHRAASTNVDRWAFIIIIIRRLGKTQPARERKRERKRDTQRFCPAAVTQTLAARRHLRPAPDSLSIQWPGSLCLEVILNQNKSETLKKDESVIMKSTNPIFTLVALAAMYTIVHLVSEPYKSYFSNKSWIFFL